ncbi:GMC oxidoreductase [Microlunatus capsulatus]|uniref:Choline dehydrogenase-like flavoprotein n=1 Tax=Microlunatus capsulatus TaxID=99117 RepID=A0ABS4Z9B2_9ACTN|nr:GMC oxidoreductase [Microlunatus capsulatus]MBP2417648.1 choline dehydrogenase-like flavoprotein [Microlunatus capsulatus]
MAGAEPTGTAAERWRAVVQDPQLRAAVDRVVPADDWPAGWAGGVGDYLAEGGTEQEWALAGLERLVAVLAGQDFAAAPPAEQDRVLSDLGGRPGPDADLAGLLRLCWEGYYATRRSAADRADDPGWPAGLAMVGFRDLPEGVTPVEAPLPPATPAARLRAHYDAVVVGSGPGGAVAAQTLARAGRSVLVVERARPLSNAGLRGDHLHGKRNAVYRSVAGPGPQHPRLAVQEDDGGGLAERLVDGDGDAWAYGLNAYAYGGGTRLWQGMAWRFFPEDFAMASTYGNPAGATLADWPLGYDELEPYYSRAEQELGVAGEEGALTARTPRSLGYPMPAMGTEPARELLAGAAGRLGWTTGAIPLAINSVPAAGRPACVRCSSCVGHACPVDAKNGAHNTFLPRALATGNTEVVLDAEVIAVHDGPAGASVEVMTGCSGEPVLRTVRADVVVVAAGAVESARLLLASGLGNDHLGRHLHDHRFVSLRGEVDQPVKNGLGPGHSVATLDHVHAGTIPWGGGVLVDLMSVLPLTSATDPGEGVPRWGAGHKRWMREGRPHAFGVFGMGQEVPSETSAVTLAGVLDRWGRPGARLRKSVHPASREVEAGMAALGTRWLEAAGARGVRQQRGGATASAAGEHSCGTARMSDDPATGATDRFGRLWGAHRVVVCDSSLHPTNGSVNPTLTIVANALRVAERLVDDWPR